MILFLAVVLACDWLFMRWHLRQEKSHQEIAMSALNGTFKGDAPLLPAVEQKDYKVSDTYNKLKGLGLYSWEAESLLPAVDFDVTTEVIVLLFVRGSDHERRHFLRNSIGKFLMEKSIHLKFQVLFVFGYGHKPTQEDVEKWKEESMTYRDLIMPGK